MTGASCILGSFLMSIGVLSDSNSNVPDVVILLLVGSFTLGLIFVWLGIQMRKSERLNAEWARRRAEVEREAQVKEIVDAVKSTIKVRCRYCGTLNEEKEKTCESCGGPL